MRCQKQVSQGGIGNRIPQNTVGYNYLSIPETPASGTKVFIFIFIFDLWVTTVFHDKHIQQIQRNVCGNACQGQKQTDSTLVVLPLITLAYLGQVTHMCVGKLNAIVSDNGLSPSRRDVLRCLLSMCYAVCLIYPMLKRFMARHLSPVLPLDRWAAIMSSFLSAHLLNLNQGQQQALGQKIITICCLLVKYIGFWCYTIRGILDPWDKQYQIATVRIEKLTNIQWWYNRWNYTVIHSRDTCALNIHIKWLPQAWEYSLSNGRMTMKI